LSENHTPLVKTSPLTNDSNQLRRLNHAEPQKHPHHTSTTPTHKKEPSPPPPQKIHHNNPRSLHIPILTTTPPPPQSPNHYPRVEIRAVLLISPQVRPFGARQGRLSSSCSVGFCCVGGVALEALTSSSSSSTIIACMAGSCRVGLMPKKA